jgi:hypothetical protein
MEDGRVQEQLGAEAGGSHQGVGQPVPEELCRSRETGGVQIYNTMLQIWIWLFAADFDRSVI